MTVTVTQHSNFDAVYAHLMAAARLAQAETALGAVNVAKVLAPVDTGRYRNALRTASNGYQGDDYAAAEAGDLAATDVQEVADQIDATGTIEIGSYIHYAADLEFGNSHMAARPTIQTACAAVLPNIGVALALRVRGGA